MIKRQLTASIIEIAQKMPVIAILGPRQSGKTTLVRTAFPHHRYVSLENFEDREFATQDSKRFLELYHNSNGIILDEIQQAPRLLSYIQTFVDEEHRPGYIILTGSQNILMNQAISQTLAGRIALFTLPPLSITELAAANLLPKTIEELAFTGGYPRIYAHHLAPTRWYLDYVETYVERDARQVGNIEDLNTFKRFLRLCAGRVGQLLNYTSLASDCGIDQRTAKAWLSILEASYIVFLLQPHHVNFNKRLIKSPKLYFYDTGLVSALLGIDSPELLHTNYMRGAIIESLIISEIYKHYYNSGSRPQHVYFWRNQTGNEIDCVIQRGNALVPIEIKSGKTIGSDFFDGLTYWASLTKASSPVGYVIYGGEQNQQRSQGTIVSWRSLEEIFAEPLGGS
jgi:predicted AAA+ superfamily ATPase